MPGSPAAAGPGAGKAYELDVDRSDVTGAAAVPRGRVRPRLRRDWGWVVGVAALAFVVRLSSVQRGGGLFGRIDYDGSVYYAASSALAHGLLPYRDYLLLHPPGIVLALLPFAALGRLIGDADALALARLSWFGLGALNTVLVFVLVRSRGRWPAVAAATFYAVFVPAVTGEHTVSLEAVGSVCVLGAVALLMLGRRPRAGSVRPLVGAGLLLGFASSTKIWGVVIVLAVVGWSIHREGVRRALVILAGAVGMTVLVCLPFFLAAPATMWRMVVVDQVGRRREPTDVLERIVDIGGFSEVHRQLGTDPLAALAVLCCVVILALALRDPLGRLAAVLLVVMTALLQATPSWSVPYAALSAPALALLLGCAVAQLGRSRWSTGRMRVAVAGAVAAALAGYVVACLPGLVFGTPFPGRSMETVFAAVPGCVTTDDPIALIETGALRRNLERHCPLVVDLSGYSYDLRPAADLRVRRWRNTQWQQHTQSYLGSGDAMVMVRFRTAPGLSRETKAVISSWPVLLDVEGYQVRRPEPRTAYSPR